MSIGVSRYQLCMDQASSPEVLHRIGHVPDSGTSFLVLPAVRARLAHAGPRPGSVGDGSRHRCRRIGGGRSMPKYLIQGSYTRAGLEGLVEDGGSGRRKAVEGLAKGVG